MNIEKGNAESFSRFKIILGFLRFKIILPIKYKFICFRRMVRTTPVT